MACKTGGQGATGVSDDAQEEQDDDPSSLNSHGSSDEETETEEEGEEEEDGEALACFRKQWKEELIRKHNQDGGKMRLPSGVLESSTETSGEATPTHELPKSSHHVQEDVMQKAKDLFLSGVNFEQKGMMHEAIRGYNQAVHLVPDIEHRLYDQIKVMQTSNGSSQLSGRDSPILSTCVKESEEHSVLYTVFESRIACMPNGVKMYCTPHKDWQGQMHISQLPVEVLLHILRWVVSSDLDIRSLETMSIVSAGWYVLCRRGDLWKSACKQLWGHRTGNLDVNFPTYRSMYILRPHLLFNGVYISKITYVRHGETSFQDQFYRPWHLVVYYRYLRFFSDGSMHMLTTADDPYTVLPYLKSKCARYQGILTEMQIESLRHRKHAKLVWRNYLVTVVYRSGQISKSEMDIDDQKFPYAIFSRVKSYSVNSDTPLVA